MLKTQKDLQELLKLLGEVREKIGEIGEIFKMTLPKMIRAGELLTNIQDSLPYGSWGKWCKENLPISERHASRYMYLYKNRDLLPSSDILSELSLCNVERLLPHRPSKAPKGKPKSKSDITLNDKTWGKIEQLRANFPGSSDAEIIMACVDGTYKAIAPTTQISTKVYIPDDSKVPDLEKIQKKITSLTNNVASASNWIKKGKPLLKLDRGGYSKPLRFAVENLIQQLKGFNAALSADPPTEESLSDNSSVTNGECDPQARSDTLLLN